MEPYNTKTRRWLTVIAAIITTHMNIGALRSLGALFVPISEKYDTNRSSTALVHSLMLGASAFAVIAGALIEKYGLWKMALVGTILTSVGFGGGFFATTIVHLYIFVGVFAGTGIVTMFMCTLVAIGLVTDGRTKSAVLTINSSCIGIWASVYPHLFNLLILEYGLNGTYLIIAGICCNNMGFVFLLSDLSLPSTNSTNSINLNSTDLNTTTNRGLCTQKANLLFKAFIHCMQAKLLQIFSVPYALILIASVAVMATADAYTVLYVDIYISNAFSEEQGFYSMIPYKVGSVGAGLLAGLLKQFKPINSFAVSIFYSLIGCPGVILIYISSSLWMAYAGSLLIGMTDGGIFAGITLIVADLVSEEQYGTACGLIITSFTCIAVAMGPLFGALRDATQSYASVFLAIAIIQLCTAGIYLAALVVHRRSKSTTHVQGPARSNSTSGVDNPSFNTNAAYSSRRPSFVR